MKSTISNRVRNEGNPLIDGTQVTFVWLGKRAPLLMADFYDWERGQLLELTKETSDTWIYEVELPADAYMEYSFFQEGERILDPFNPRLTPDGFGHHNHYFYMPAAQPTDLTAHHRNVPHGAVTRQQIETRHLVAGITRIVYLYQPPVTEPCPLLVVWDGREYLRRARLNLIIDNLIHQKRIQPVALALVENHQSARMSEYSCSESTLAFLLNSVLPLASGELNILDVEKQPASFGVLGASMGGLMALYTALRLPVIFGRVICQSGGFSFGERETIVYELVEKCDPRPIKIWMDIGLDDLRFLLHANRKLYQRLVERGYDVTYREYPAGHNYPAWRDEVWRGLEALFCKKV
jgi:enterochelin esterase-like enzyme